MQENPTSDLWPQHLRRPRTGRLIAGVAAGAADYLDVDVVLVRLGLVALALAGGLGVPLYLAAWLLVPEEGEDEGVVEHLLGHCPPGCCRHDERWPSATAMASAPPAATTPPAAPPWTAPSWGGPPWAGWTEGTPSRGRRRPGRRRWVGWQGDPPAGPTPPWHQGPAGPAAGPCAPPAERRPGTPTATADPEPTTGGAPAPPNDPAQPRAERSDDVATR